MAQEYQDANYSISVANSLGGGSRAPILRPSEYTSWVRRMTNYLMGHDADIWTYVSTGTHNPDFLKSIVVPEVEVSAETMKSLSAGIATASLAKDRKVKRLEAKAMQELLSGIPHDIYEQIPDDEKETPHDVWVALKKQFEGTPKIIANRMKSAILEMDNFKMQPNESIYEAYSRFNVIVNKVKKFKADRSQSEINSKFLDSLTPKWHMAQMLIVHTATNLDIMSLYELYGELQQHEAKINQNSTSQMSSSASTYPGPPSSKITASRNPIPNAYADYSIPQIANGYVAIDEESEDLTEQDYQQCLALLSQMKPGFKKFFNRSASGNYKAQSYQQPDHYQRNSGNFQGGNNKYNQGSRNENSNEDKGSNSKSKAKDMGSDSEEEDAIICHKCQGKNHYAKDCKKRFKPVKDEAYYLKKAEQIKN
ncbi:hypothetical protein E9993_22700 [Labilibacter sediminis]|nr:hypothetical protein E9993_22700 [Labilibacter sediminis]